MQLEYTIQRKFKRKNLTWRDYSSEPFTDRKKAIDDLFELKKNQALYPPRFGAVKAEYRLVSRKVFRKSNAVMEKIEVE
jgi:hypothetical protein